MHKSCFTASTDKDLYILFYKNLYKKKSKNSTKVSKYKQKPMASYVAENLS